MVRSRALIKAGANTEIPDQHGCPPLHHAAAKGHAQVIEALLEGGADVDRLDPGGYTAVRYAAVAGSAETLRALARHGADFGLDPENKGQPRVGWGPWSLARQELVKKVAAWFEPGAAQAERENWLLSTHVASVEPLASASKFRL